MISFHFPPQPHPHFCNHITPKQFRSFSLLSSSSFSFSFSSFVIIWTQRYRPVAEIACHSALPTYLCPSILSIVLTQIPWLLMYQLCNLSSLPPRFRLRGKKCKYIITRGICRIIIDYTSCCRMSYLFFPHPPPNTQPQKKEQHRFLRSLLLLLLLFFFLLLHPLCLFS